MKVSKIISALVALAGMALLVWASVIMVSPVNTVSAQGEFPIANGEDLFNYVTKDNPYTEWGHWPDASLEGILPSGPPHGKSVRIFVNDVALSVADKFPGKMPEHSIIVKENYGSADVKNPGPVKALTIMYKVAGFAPDNSDWFWLKVSPDGKIDMEGEVGMCQGCHLKIKNNRDGITRYGFGGEPAVLNLAVQPIDMPAMPDSAPAFPATTGEDLFNYVTKDNPYTKWGQWPDASLEGILPSGPPHGKSVRIFVNDIALSVADKFPGKMPEHSIIVKENYGSADVKNPGPVKALTIMYKVAGFAPDNSDWFWLKVSPDGKVDMEGEVGMCQGCHLKIKNNRDGITRYGFGGEPAVLNLAVQPIDMPAMPDSASAATFPATTGQDLFNYITKDNPYTKWGHWPDATLEGILPSGPPHGKSVRIFVNDIALSVADKFPGKMPEHSIIVKENYGSADVKNPGPVKALTVMYKVAGFAPDKSDWFWMKASPDGKIDMEGEVGMCQGCHLKIKNNRDGITRYGFGGEPAVLNLAVQPVDMPAMPDSSPGALPESGGEGTNPLLFVAIGLLLLGAGWGLWRTQQVSS